MIPIVCFIVSIIPSKTVVPDALSSNNYSSPPSNPPPPPPPPPNRPPSKPPATGAACAPYKHTTLKSPLRFMHKARHTQAHSTTTSIFAAIAPI